jgi:hypothetical protein
VLLSLADALLVFLLLPAPVREFVVCRPGSPWGQFPAGERFKAGGLEIDCKPTGFQQLASIVLDCRDLQRTCDPLKHSVGCGAAGRLENRSRAMGERVDRFALFCEGVPQRIRCTGLP